MAVDIDTDRKGRTLLVYNFVLALCLGIPAGANGPSIIVPFAIIPAAFSAALGLIALGGGLRKPCVAIPLDSILVAAYAALLIPTWVILSNNTCQWNSPNSSRRCSSGGMMLATYATVPIIVNLIIHSYCVARHLPLTGARSQTVCPNCHHEHEVRSKFLAPPSTLFARSTVPSTIYTPDDDEEDEQVAREFDETSPLRRASSDIDGSTLWAGEGGRLMSQPPAYSSKRNGDRQV